MSEHGTPAIKSADDPAFQLPAKLAVLRSPLTIGGLVLTVIGAGIGWQQSDRFGMSVYLTALMYCLTISVGCLFFVLIQHLSRAGWSTVVRRVAELVMMMIIPVAILFIPVLVTLWSGDGVLYNWDDPDYGETMHLKPDIWEVKTGWLNATWFSIRSVIYFAIYASVAIFFFRGSVQQDSSGDPAISDRLQYWSGPAVMICALTTSALAFDFVMSLDPMWFSTMFGVYIFAGSMLSAHCVITVATFLLQKTGAMRDEVTVEHYHDLGKYLFGFVFFWTYIGFSQFLLIWYGNIPEETVWFFHRQEGVWVWVSITLIFLHWLLPFTGLLSRHVRRNPALVCFWAVYLLVMHFVDVYWMVMPQAAAPDAGPATMGGILGVLASLLCTVGMVALLTGLVLRIAEQTKVIAVQDPRLQESIAFENI